MSKKKITLSLISIVLAILLMTIPNTVKEIGLWAFSDCTSLSNVNLGNVE